jgi:hypothetical protein
MFAGNLPYDYNPEHTATHCNTLPHATTRCNTLQQTCLPSTFNMPATQNTLQNTATYDLANTYFATNLPHDCHPVGALGMPEGTMKLVLCRY